MDGRIRLDLGGGVGRPSTDRVPLADDRRLHTKARAERDRASHAPDGHRPAESCRQPTLRGGADDVRRIDLLAVDEVPDGTMKFAWVDGVDPVLVVNVGGRIRAMQGICSHEYFELDKGFLTGDSLTCALHLSRFDLETGDALDPPAELPLALYPVIVEDGRIFIEVPDGPLPVNA